jgi:hypothetical protein
MQRFIAASTLDMICIQTSQSSSPIFLAPPLVLVHPATRTRQPAPRDSHPATRNSQPPILLDLDPHLLILLCRPSAPLNVNNVTPRRNQHRTQSEPLTDMLHDGVIARESVSAEGVVVVRRDGEDREGHDWGVSETLYSTLEPSNMRLV